MKKKIIVVGAGIAGLTAAAYLSRDNHDVLLIEKCRNCGGLINSLNIKGFYFDLGAKSIENAGIIKPMLKELGIDLNLIKSPVSLGIEDKMIDFNSKESLDNYSDLLKDLYPKSGKEIENVIAFCKKIYKDMEVLYGIDNPYFGDSLKDKEFLIKKMLPFMVKFFFAIRNMDKFNEPIESFLKKMSKNQSLIDIISQHFFKKTPAFFALGYFYVYMDYFYPKGGSGKLSKSIEKKIIEFGGKIKKNAFISKVVPFEKKIIDSLGNEYYYDELIWAADLKYLYKIIDSKGLNKKIALKMEDQKKEFLSKRGGDSSFALMLGVDDEPQNFSKISKPHLFYTPLKKGLGETHLSRLKKLLKDFDKANKKEIFEWLDDFCMLNTYEISIPCLRDSSLAPKGKTGLIISFLMDYDLIKKIHDAGWIGEFLEKCKKSVIKSLEKIYPNLSDKIIFSYYFTPLSISNNSGISEGAITGWSYEDKVPVANNLFKMADSVKTPIPNIFQAGQWVYSPAGIPTAILTGWHAAQKIIKGK